MNRGILGFSLCNGVEYSNIIVEEWRVDITRILKKGTILLYLGGYPDFEIV